jgi:quercetin dioxygenase-like cupin family protein
VIRETPYGSVDFFHDGSDLLAWWIEKDGEEIDPAWSSCDREDVLYVAEGTLRLELEGNEPVDLAAGSVFVIPPNSRFRGYRWPRDGARCRFLAVAPAGATFS